MSTKKSSRRGRRPPCTVDNAKIGFVGAGKIVQAIIAGLVNADKGNKANRVDPKRIYVAAPSTTNTERIKEMILNICKNDEELKDKLPDLSKNYTKRNLDIFARFDCDIIFLAVHGNVIQKCYDIGGVRPAALTTNFIPNMKHKLYILSLISGKPLSQVKAVLLNPDHPEAYKPYIEWHRIVINCAAAQHMGVCGVDIEPDSADFGEPIRALLTRLAPTLQKIEDDKQMDAACAVIGSGLAIAYTLMNAMAESALKLGLPSKQASTFVAKTVYCAAETQILTNTPPNDLKDQVCAPSGGAAYGLSALDKADVYSSVAGAIEAARNRAKEMCETGFSKKNQN